MITNVSRRDFFKSSGALVLAVALPEVCAQTKSAWQPNAFVRVSPDNTVTVIVKHLEMGQGTYTGLPTLVAEEMDADWAQIRVEGAPADAKRYNNLFWGPAQGTGGSTALANSWEQLRKAGAAARRMLVAAAAERWQVPKSELTVSKGVVHHARTRKRATFGELAAAASTEVVPVDAVLKEPKDFTYIGKAALTRVDARAKSNGSALYTQDVKLPGLLTAVVLHPPRFGATLARFDAAKAKEIRGVVDVVPFSTPATNGVAVLAGDYWSAKKGRDALVAEWDESSALRLGSAEIMAEYKSLAVQPGAPARKVGDAEGALRGAAKTLQAGYEFPFLAHAAMEPMNCVVSLGPQGCEVWNGEQFQTVDQAALAQLLGLQPGEVKLNMLYAGGSFGRRANPHSDFLLEAAAIAKAIEGRAPVKLVWGREDDMRAGYYRPMYYHALEAGLGGDGKLVAWRHTIVGQSILAGTAFESARW
jgi:isoquinoline 1-oxidoreductase beta subunit